MEDLQARKFKITLKSDYGNVNFIAYNFNQESAIKSVLDSERAPGSALVRVRELKMKKTYNQLKEEARLEAIEWQNDFGNHNYSYGELTYFGDYFEKLGKRYGLLREFRENGIC